MKLKQAILSIMDRDTLKNMVNSLEINDVDRRSIDGMRDKGVAQPTSDTGDAAGISERKAGQGGLRADGS